jgi:hypothetical protein
MVEVSDSTCTQLGSTVAGRFAKNHSGLLQDRTKPEKNATFQQLYIYPGTQHILEFLRVYLFELIPCVPYGRRAEARARSNQEPQIQEDRLQTMSQEC